MFFSNPYWNSSTNSYNVKIITPYEFSYSEIRDKSSGSENKEIDITNTNFQDVMNKLADAVFKEGSTWFASPIKQTIFIKKAKHNIDIPGNSVISGNMNEYTWTPIYFDITSKYFEIKWKLVSSKPITVIPSNFVDFSEDLEEVEPRTIVIQHNEIIENAEIPFDNSEKDVHTISSRAAGMLLKQKVRKAKLKAAVATMKAERMAEKYFRRYGIQTNLDSDSDISFDSDEESSELE